MVSFAFCKLKAPVKLIALILLSLACVSSESKADATTSVGFISFLCDANSFSTRITIDFVTGDAGVRRAEAPEAGTYALPTIARSHERVGCSFDKTHSVSIMATGPAGTVNGSLDIFIDDRIIPITFAAEPAKIKIQGAGKMNYTVTKCPLVSNEDNIRTGCKEWSNSDGNFVAVK